MTNYREILRLHSHQISQRDISMNLGISRNTVSSVISRATSIGLRWPFDVQMSDTDIQKLLFPRGEDFEERKVPDYDLVHKQLQKDGMTLKYLWFEYVEQCKAEKDIPFMYTQFCLYYRKHVQSAKAVMHINRKPGDQIEVDWAGKTLKMINNETGEIQDVYLFVGVLSYSLYSFVEAKVSMDLDNWIEAHVNMYRYFNGVTRLLVPDNLKTGVTKIEDRIPQINKTYQEMAEHYDTVILPARVRKPRDKANAENGVKYATMYINRALRNQQFFSIREINEAIKPILKSMNEAPFTKKHGSRQSLFLAEEKPLMAALPASDYERATWKTATVQFNYHIQVEKMHYSVPHEYIKHQVDVRLTQRVVEVFYHHRRIASHPRKYGHPGQYSTYEIHMPEDHQSYMAWNKERFLQWATRIGPYTHNVVEKLFMQFQVEEQGYQRAMTLLKLGERYGVERLENASKKALSLTIKPTLKILKDILSTSLDKDNTYTKTEKKNLLLDLQEEQTIMEEKNYDDTTNHR